MKMIRRDNIIVIAVTLFITTNLSYGQIRSVYPLTITKIAEEMSANETDIESVTSILETLQELNDDPVIINDADEIELSRLPFLTNYQIKSLIYHIKTTGNILSVYEIATIPGFDKNVTEMMLPFIELDAGTEEKFTNRLRTDILSNFIIKTLENDTGSTGSSIKNLTKIKLIKGQFQGGLTIEKDEGEAFLSGSPKRPDFLSGHLAFKGKGFIREIIIGDFSAKFGQGININNGFGTSLSLSTTNMISASDNIKPYTSSNENNFFRGAATSLSMGNMNVVVFFSHNKQDATLEYNQDIGGDIVKSLYTSGLHNNITNLNKKDRLTETDLAVNLFYDFRSLKVGASFNSTQFSVPFKNTENDPGDFYEFEGKTNNTWSLHYQATIDKIMLFGELSTNSFSNMALVQGMNIRPSDRLTINLLYRNYPPEFITFHARGPGSSSTTSNEMGFFGNFSFEVFNNLFLIAGADICRFPWISYRTSFPSIQHKEEVRLVFKPTDLYSCEIACSMRYSEQNETTDRGMPSMKSETARSLKAIASIKATNNIILKSRIEYKSVFPLGNEGFLMLQDIVYNSNTIPVSFWFRYCLFTTDNWNSRIYTYENDLLYSFSIPAMYGQGSRMYLMAGYNINRAVEVRIKYGITTTPVTETYDGTKDELKIQLRIKL